MPHIIYEINSHVWLNEQPWASGKTPDLAAVPDSVIREWAEMGIDFVWFLGVWKRGKASREICLSNPDLRATLERALPALTPDQVAGSPFSIAEYSLNPALGGKDTLARLRKRLNAHGIRLMLDFVPNHLAVDHAWTLEHPERFINGSDVEIERKPSEYFRVPGRPGTILAHGRDPYFAAWTDTVQINLSSADTRAALQDLLLEVSEVCDGVRCDMAMLITNAVFKQTWGDLSVMDYPQGNPPEFWAGAISAVKKAHPDFLFLAEVYWGLERQLQNLGFDCTYDKTLYDLARSGDGAGIRRHLHDTLDCENQMVRFLENHDESRAAYAFGNRHRALAVLVLGLPGVKLLHEGQMEGRQTRLPVQLGARPQEPVDLAMREFYANLLAVAGQPVMRDGQYRPLYVSEAWETNHTAAHIVTCWRSQGEEHRLVAVNIGETQAQCYTEIPADFLTSEAIEFRDLLSDALYYRSSSRLRNFGLYLDMPAGGYHIFQVGHAPSGQGPDAH